MLPSLLRSEAYYDISFDNFPRANKLSLGTVSFIICVLNWFVTADVAEIAIFELSSTICNSRSQRSSGPVIHHNDWQGKFTGKTVSAEQCCPQIPGAARLSLWHRITCSNRSQCAFRRCPMITQTNVTSFVYFDKGEIDSASVSASVQEYISNST